MCRPLLLGRAMRLTGGDMDAAQDLLSATILKAANHFEGKAFFLREPRAFFLSALRNEFISQYRRRRIEFNLFETNLDVYEDRLPFAFCYNAPQERHLLEQEEIGEICRFLLSMPLNYQQIFKLKFLEERSYSDIASALSISQALARKRVQFLRDKLRLSLGSQSNWSAE